MPSLIQHQKSSKQCPCPRCNDFDSYEELLEAHLPSVDQYACLGCRQRFAHEMSLEAHQHESKHGRCHKCNTIYPTRQLHALHMRSHSLNQAIIGVISEYRCCDCEREFKNYKQLIRHLEIATVHKSGHEANPKLQKSKPECKKCKKTFKSDMALQQHLASIRHHPLSNIKCVAHVKCKRRFNCPSGLLHHLEAGKCVSGMTKEKLDVGIAAVDTGRVISSLPTQWLLEESCTSTNSTTSESPGQSLILTPTSTEFQGSYPPSPNLAPSFVRPNSPGFHQMTLLPGIVIRPQPCHRCPPSSTRTFTPNALQQHLSSGTHSKVGRMYTKLSIVDDEFSYHCPAALVEKGSKQSPARNFSTVSALAQHLETGACDGGDGTFRRAVEFVQDEMKALGFGRVKLLR